MAFCCGAAIANQVDIMTDITRSNSLADLAARIKVEHEAVSVALKDSVRTPLLQASC